MIFVYAVAFVILCDGSTVWAERFGSVPDAVVTLLLWGTIPDFADVAYQVTSLHRAPSQRTSWVPGLQLWVQTHLSGFISSN